jgi:hypothetical protein
MSMGRIRLLRPLNALLNEPIRSTGGRSSDTGQSNCVSSLVELCLSKASQHGDKSKDETSLAADTRH